MADTSFKQMLLQEALDDFSYHLANGALARGQLREADELYRRALGVKSDHGAARYMLGVVGRQLGTADGAGTVRSSEEETRAAARAEFDLGRTFELQGNQAEAASAFRRAVAVDPCHVGALHAFAAARKDDAAALEQVIRLFRRVVNLVERQGSDDLSWVYVSIGEFFLSRGMIEDSRRAMELALELESPHPSTRVRLLAGQISYREQRLSEALRHFRGTGEQSRSIGLLRLEASICENLGLIDEALAACRVAAEIAPQDPLVFYRKAEVLQTAGEFVLAGESLRQAAQLGLQRMLVACAQASLALSQGRLEAAELAIAEAEALDRVAPAVLLGKCRVLAAAGRFDEALELCQRGLAAGSARQFLIELGGITRLVGKQDEAEQAYRAFIAQVPRSIWARLPLAGLLQAQGRFEEAIALCHEAIAIEPEMMWSRVYLGSALAAVGRADDATAAYRAALVRPLPLGRVHDYFGPGREPLDKAAAAARAVSGE